MAARENHGDSWTEPRVLARRPDSRLAALAGLAREVLWLATGNRYEVCAVD